MHISWTDELKVGVGFIDADHEEAVRLMAVMAEAEGPALTALFGEFVHHCQEHFARENDLMSRIGFFAIDCHMDEHERVLAELADMAGRDEAALKTYVRSDLPEWFLGHRNSMDFVTAQFARQMGER